MKALKKVFEDFTYSSESICRKIDDYWLAFLIENTFHCHKAS